MSKFFISANGMSIRAVIFNGFYIVLCVWCGLIEIKFELWIKVVLIIF